MAEYLLRLAILLPLLGLLIWGSLRLTRFLQTRLVGMQSGSRAVQLVETSLVAPGLKLAVVRFHDREILLGCSRQGLVRLAETGKAPDAGSDAGATSGRNTGANQPEQPAETQQV